MRHQLLWAICCGCELLLGVDALAGDPPAPLFVGLNAPAVGVSDAGEVLTSNGHIWTYSGGLRPAGGNVRISADANYTIGAGGNSSFRYTVATGTSQPLPPPPGGFNTFVTAISADGAVCAGYDLTTDRPWRWTQSTGSVTINTNGT